jgi:hypothetical protein
VVARIARVRIENRNNVSLFTRLTAHLGIIALVLIGLLLSGIEIRAAQQPRNYDTAAPQSNLPAVNLDSTGAGNDLTLPAVPFTIQPKTERREVTTYTVKPGDNVSVIAARFGVTPDSVIWQMTSSKRIPTRCRWGKSCTFHP